MKKPLQTPTNYGIIVPTKGDYAYCPHCMASGISTRLFRMDMATEASHMPVYCRRCKREIFVNINQGQCLQDQSQ